MNKSKMRKAHEKNGHHTAPLPEKKRDEIIDVLLRGLDALAAMAEGANMGPATRIMHLAKEELIHWAVNMNFQESSQDRFINQRLYNNRLSLVESLLIRAINDSGKQVEMLDLLGFPLEKHPSPAPRK